MKKLGVLMLCGLFLLMVPQVQAKTLNERGEVVGVEFYNPCTDETVIYSGKIHYNERFMDSKNGRRAHGRNHVNFSIVGIGITSGDPYYGEAVENDVENVTLEGNGQGTDTGVANAMIVNLETGVVANLKYSYHITINANGEITVEFEKGDFDYECSELED